MDAQDPVGQFLMNQVEMNPAPVGQSFLQKRNLQRIPAERMGVDFFYKIDFSFCVFSEING